MIALDTNVISELMRREPDARVLAWADSLEDREIAVPLVVLAELFRGLNRLPDGARRRKLELALEAFLSRVDERRLLAFDLGGAVAFGAVMASREHAGRPLSVTDGMIAATCRAHRVTLATRNVRDFTGTGLHVLDPWR